MASKSQRPNGDWWVFFKAPNGRRQTVRLGSIDRRSAETFEGNVERLLALHRMGRRPDPDTEMWLSRLDDTLYLKLSQLGLCSNRGPRTVGALTGLFLAHAENEQRRGAKKASTLVNLRVAAATVDKFFGRDKQLADLDKPPWESQDAGNYRDWLERDGKAKGGPLAPATATGICRRAREIFTFAVKRKWMHHNPFSEQKGWVFTNPERDVYIPTEVAEAVIAACPDLEMQLAVALARYAFLRCPSEPKLLKWGWVDWEHSTLFVSAPKTGRYAGKETRIVPIPQRLVDLLGQQFHAVPAGSEQIFLRMNISRAALADRLEAACRRAGIAMWPKPFVNLRASCEYDWMRTHPIDEVAEWTGHSAKTMLTHYNRVFKELSAQRGAAALRTKTQSKSEAKTEAPYPTETAANDTSRQQTDGRNVFICSDLFAKAPPVVE